MVAKINIGSSLYGALAYNGLKVNEGEGKLITTNRVFDSGTGKVDIARVVRDFERYMPLRMRTEKPVIHISLNPHPDDILTDTELEVLAREYMDRLGYGEQPYLVFKHEDIARHHLHIVSIRVGVDGKRLNNDFIYRRSKRITDALEKEYGLHPSDAKRKQVNEPAHKVNAGVGDVKRQMNNALVAVTGKYRYQTLGEYRALLSLYNMTVEETRGEIRGREYHGFVYSALDERDVKTGGNPLKSSLFGKRFGYDVFEKWCADSKGHFKEDKSVAKTKANILAALRSSNSRETFLDTLKKCGIDVVFRCTEEDRIYGTTFIDHKTCTVMNGSRMGKELSANALQETFTRMDSGLQVEEHPSSEAHFTSAISPTQQSEISLEQQSTSVIEDYSSGDGLGLLETHGTDYEEEAFIRRMQRKKSGKHHSRGI